MNVEAFTVSIHHDVLLHQRFAVQKGQQLTCASSLTASAWWSILNREPWNLAAHMTGKGPCPFQASPLTSSVMSECRLCRHLANSGSPL